MSDATVSAYINHGRVIADCTRPYCGNAMQLKPRQRDFVCGGQGGCGLRARVSWPGDIEGIIAALSERPVPATRNWFPKDHPLATRGHLPHGQTARDLQEETREYGGGL